MRSGGHPWGVGRKSVEARQRVSDGDYPPHAIDRRSVAGDAREPLPQFDRRHQLAAASMGTLNSADGGVVDREHRLALRCGTADRCGRFLPEAGLRGKAPGWRPRTATLPLPALAGYGCAAGAADGPASPSCQALRPIGWHRRVGLSTALRLFLT